MSDKRFSQKELDDCVAAAYSVRDDGDYTGRRAFDEVCRNFRSSGDEDAVAYLNGVAAGDETLKRKLYNYCIYLTGLGAPFAPQFAPVADLDVKKRPLGVDFDGGSVTPVPVNYSRAELEEFINRSGKEPSFGDLVFKFMEEKGLEAPQVYRRACIRRQDFSRLTGPKCTGMRIGKVFNVAIGLGLGLGETQELLHSAGFWLKGTPFETVVCFFIKNGVYDVPAINMELAARGLETLTQYESFDF